MKKATNTNTVEDDYNELIERSSSKRKQEEPGRLGKFSEQAKRTWNIMTRYLQGTTNPTNLEKEIPVLIITTHGDIREFDSFQSPINYLTINSVPYDVCNYVDDTGSSLEGLANSITKVRDSINGE